MSREDSLPGNSRALTAPEQSWNSVPWSLTASAGSLVPLRNKKRQTEGQMMRRGRDCQKDEWEGDGKTHTKIMNTVSKGCLTICFKNNHLL